MTAQTEKFEFKAEVNQLLDILVHSLYTNREIFLRELVSNASDALDKMRFAINSNPELEDEVEPEILIAYDEEKKTVTVTDTGIGMTREEVMTNIGTIAHSGSAEFVKQAAESKESLDSLIGRFGVGFYSIFMVSDHVVVRTKSYLKDEPAIQWVSDGKNAYELTEVEAEMDHGTIIEIQLNEDNAERFGSDDKLKDIVKRHSNFVSFPIMIGGERVNTVSALWREPKFQIKQEQYEEFYKFLTYDVQPPIDTLHFSVDAPVQFNSLLFIPENDLDIFGMDRDNWGLDLYVRRVLIEKQNKNLLPEYLSFIKGVVDTEDLPLNISRETLQDNLLIGKISATLTKQVLGQLEKLAKDDEEKYAKFWKAHSKIFKAGHMDFVNRDKYAGLLRFDSSKAEENTLVSFADYIERAKEDQKEIYYSFVASREAANLNPHLEIFRNKDIEVLYLYEPIDEFVMESIREHEGFNFVAAEYADLEKLDKFESTKKEDEPEPLSEDQEKDMEALIAKMKEVLGEQVAEVKVSERLSDSPCRLVNPDGAMTSSMEKLMKAMNKDSSIPTKTMEVNAGHPLLRSMLEIFKVNPEDEFIALSSNQLLESALLLEGYLNDPHALVGRIQSLLTKAGGWYAELEKKD
ncbi:molecular chaperone HtpG [Maridesulfovibrio salexigens]|uniref:Chaperone protein HtpG n=1 Tax=Maridesulfovibrio salexigens (strain ATCC 14822 / DSM 2638 / NCIMB 8403 / VKM B-1763) TaxID=526222 RepID=C6BSM1_MARSD|nr:molecular chaperone HtpG [Maridesulfovibrio salexigens]ACS81477.1 heat shock protein Hsp90 [Maridesulfovibrio salexigens DSM 2638]